MKIKTIFLSVILICVCLISACDGSGRVDAVCVQSFCSNEVAVIPMSVKAWQTGEYKCCKFQCRSFDNMLSRLEKGIERVENIRYTCDDSGLKSEACDKDITFTIKDFENGAVLLEKYTGDEVSDRFAAVYYDERAVLSPAAGIIADKSLKNTVSILFPQYFLEEPTQFVQYGLYNGKQNMSGTEYSSLCGYDDWLAFYEACGKYEIEKGKAEFSLTGYNGALPKDDVSYLPPLENTVQFKFLQTDEKNSVQINIL